MRGGESQPRPAALAAIFGLGLSFRLAYFAEFHRSPFFGLLHGDPEIYHQRALAILAGHFAGSGVDFHSSPIYPYFLALVYKLAGAHVPAAFVAQSLIGATSATLLAWIGWRLGGAALYWMSGVTLALWPVLAFLDNELLEMTLVLIGVNGMILLLLRARRRECAKQGSRGTLLGAGACLGLAALGKPNSLLFLPLWFLWEWRRTREPIGATLRRLVPLALGTALVVFPFTLRNRLVGGDWVLTSSNGGINLYIGNNPEARGTFSVPARMEADLFAASRTLAEQARGRPLRPSEVSSYWAGEAARWLMSHPVEAARLYLRKLLLLVNHLEIPNHFDLNFLARDLWLLRVSPFRFGLFFPFALWGLALAVREVRRGHGDWDVPLVWTGAYALSLLPFFVTERYRLPAVTVLLVFAARGLLDIVTTLRSRERRLPLAAAATVAIGFGLTFLPLAKAEDFFPAQLQILAGAARDRGDFAGAADYYREALALQPQSVLAHNSLGTSLARLGRVDEAAREFEAALKIDPNYPPAWRNLARWRGQTQGPAAEIECLDRAVALDPGFWEARRDIVRALTANGRYAEALPQLDALLAHDPADRSSLWNRALLLGQFLGRPAEALATLDRLESAGGANEQTRQLRAQLTGR
ncbi:MAG: tetratricopeptide repeat protein [Candidatus Eisenbacteria bacterium]